MPAGTDLHGDEVVELVSPVRGGGQAKPAPDRDLLDGVREGGSWHVVALVGDYQPVSGGETRDIVTAGQGLQVTTSMVPRSFTRPPPSCPALMPHQEDVPISTASPQDNRPSALSYYYGAS